MASREKFQKLLRSFSYRRQMSFWSLASSASDMWRAMSEDQRQAAVDEDARAAIWKAGYEMGRQQAMEEIPVELTASLLELPVEEMRL